MSGPWDSKSWICSRGPSASVLALVDGTLDPSDLPQPNMGEPGTGDLILTFFGDAGVLGRADMVRMVSPISVLAPGKIERRYEGPTNSVSEGGWFPRGMRAGDGGFGVECRFVVRPIWGRGSVSLRTRCADDG
jgi:hypothetical protein